VPGFGFALLTAVFPGLLAQVDSNDSETLRALSVTYAANRRALSERGDIRFVARSGKARESVVKGEQKLFSPEWIPEAEVVGRYAFESSSRFYEQVDSVLVPGREAATNRVPGSLGPSIRALTNGQRTLVDILGDPSNEQVAPHSVSISNGVAEFFRHVAAPLAPGAPGGSSVDLDHVIELIQKGINGMTLVELDANASLEGERVFRLRAQNPKATASLYIDPKRGALPLLAVWRTEIAGPPGSNIVPITRVSVFKLEDIRELVGGSWYPFKSTRIMAVEAAPETYSDIQVRELVVKSFARDEIDPTVFRIELPEARSAVNSTSHRAYTKRKVWDLGSISAGAEASARQLATSPKPQSTPPPQPSAWPAPSWLDRWPWIAAGCGLILLGVVFWIKGRKTRR
jgi:hypothetical protein